MVHSHKLQPHFATDCVSPTCCYHNPIASSSTSHLFICQQTDPPPAQLHTASQNLVMSCYLLHFNNCCTLRNRFLLWSTVKVCSGLQMLCYSTICMPSCVQSSRQTSPHQWNECSTNATAGTSIIYVDVDLPEFQAKHTFVTNMPS